MGDRLPFLATGKFGFHFALETGFEVELTLPGFQKDTGLVDSAFEPTESIIDGFAFTDDCFDGH